MSVCVSVIPDCATNQELTFSQFVSSLSVYVVCYFCSTNQEQNPVCKLVLPSSEHDLRKTVYSLFSYFMIYISQIVQMYVLIEQNVELKREMETKVYLKSNFD